MTFDEGDGNQASSLMKTEIRLTQIWGAHMELIDQGLADKLHFLSFSWF